MAVIWVNGSSLKLRPPPLLWENYQQAATKALSANYYIHIYYHDLTMYPFYAWVRRGNGKSSVFPKDTISGLWSEVNPGPFSSEANTLPLSCNVSHIYMHP